MELSHIEQRVVSARPIEQGSSNFAGRQMVGRWRWYWSPWASATENQILSSLATVVQYTPRRPSCAWVRGARGIVISRVRDNDAT